MSATSNLPPAGERPRLLVLDDETAMCQFVAEVAAQSGYAARSASTPSEVRQELEERFEVIVLDLDMPGMDGIETMRILSERSSARRLILMSGHDPEIMDSAKRIAAAHGLPVTAALTKPVRAATLRRVLGRDSPPDGGTGEPPLGLSELRAAITERQFVLEYQPQVSLRDGRWVGVEALVRWRHPSRGLLQPNRFVPLMEKSGLTIPLTTAVANLAMTECRALQSVHFGGRLSINVPPAALSLPSFADDMIALADTCGWPHEQLCCEITESSVALEPVAAAEMLKGLRARGCQLSVDDFGTGHSSLVLLGVLPFSEMKIDKSFILAALQDRTARVIVENSIKLGKELGLTVVAEGVETAAHWRWLEDLGCDVAQGFYCAKPMPVEALPDWIEHRQDELARGARPAPRTEPQPRAGTGTGGTG